MTTQDEAGRLPDPAPGTTGPSRRAVLRSAAGAGLAATAVAAGGGAAFAAARTAHAQASRTQAAPDAAPEHDGEAIVVHLRDARSGEIDVFHGTRQTRVHDRELAARLIRASR
jgi:uncharacterized membrane protein